MNGNTFGNALKEKALELRLPITHPLVNYLYAQFPDIFPLAFIGCSDAQIEELKADQQVSQLPKIYVEFLLEMGVSSGDIFLGNDIHYEYLVGYSFKKAINELFLQNRLKPLDNSKFVFWSQQSVVFAFFPVDVSDDPLVYCYGELSFPPKPDDIFRNGPIKFKDYLSEFLSMFIAEREGAASQNHFLEKYASIYR